MKTPGESSTEEMQTASRFTAPVTPCKWYLRSGTCRTRSCSLPHVRALPDAGAHISFDERVWSLSSTEDDEEGGGIRSAWRFSVASYNILADKYAKHYQSYLYREVPATYLDWHHRRSAILAELTYLQPDIICLQEVDRYEDLEAELQQLGYSGIYLQRDGGRRDGCATFWRHSLLKPALVRQIRYSQYDLKDNVALLVLFEPHGTAAGQPAGTGHTAAEDTVLQQQQQSSYQNQQQQQQQLSQQSQPKGLLSQWLPSGWLSRSNSSNSQHTRSSQLLLRPVHPTHGQVSHSHAHANCLYQIPVPLGTMQRSGGLTDRPANGAVDAAASVRRSNTSRNGSSSRHKARHRRCNSDSHRHSAELDAAAAASQTDAAAAGSVQQQQAPDWMHCALLVANTHIIFTPDKGEVKLGQARMLTHEVAQMARWYLEQQQQQQPPQPSTSSSATGNSSSSILPASGVQAVATILTGDFNATPNSPLYAYMSQGMLDLHTVNRRNVSHMSAGSGSHTHHKGYRGFRKATLSRRRSAELEQQEQKQPPVLPWAPALAAAEQQMQVAQARQQQQQLQQQQQGPGEAVTADSWRSNNSNSSSSRAATANVPALALTAQAGESSTPVEVTVSQAGDQGTQSHIQGYSLTANNTAGSPDNSKVYARNGSSWHIGPSPLQPQQQQEQDHSTPPGRQRQYRWTDKEVRRAAGMSYDELMEESLTLAQTDSSTDEDPALMAAAAEPQSHNTQIARAAAAFGQQVASGMGAAAAATAAAAAASSAQMPGEVLVAQDPYGSKSHGAYSSSGIVASAAAAGGAAAEAGGVALFGSGSGAAVGVSRSDHGSGPLLLRHGLKLHSSYKSVLGSEPEYTSSHSMFMDTCDYIWYSSTAITRQHHRNGTCSSGNSSAGSSASSSCSSWDCEDTAGAGAAEGRSGEQYVLRPVAVLVPPDGMRLNKGLPAKSLGSDHVCLCTDFELVLKD